MSHAMRPVSRYRKVRLILRIVALAAALWASVPFYWPRWNFVSLPSDPRVRYEPGAEQTAKAVAAALPGAIAEVEQAQGRPFSQPVSVFVCATQRSFEHYGYGIAGAGGFVFNGRVFLSPKLQSTPARVPRIVTHELSHLHFEQCRGFLSTAMGIPGWFKEGLAVYASHGGGAETVTEAEARDAMARGLVFRPDDTGKLLFPQTGQRDGLKPHLFYRESAMFVAYLVQRDTPAFQRTLAALEDGHDFAETFAREYHQSIATLHRDFVAKVTHRSTIAER